MLPEVVSVKQVSGVSINLISTKVVLFVVSLFIDTPLPFPSRLIGESCQLEAPLLALNSRPYCGQFEIGLKCQVLPHKHTRTHPTATPIQPKVNKSLSDRRCELIVSVWCCVWATKFNYLRPGQIYGSLEISLIGKVFSQSPLLPGKKHSLGRKSVEIWGDKVADSPSFVCPEYVASIFPIFLAAFFCGMAAPSLAACLW